jgi:hypothetical protein
MWSSENERFTPIFGAANQTSRSVGGALVLGGRDDPNWGRRWSREVSSWCSELEASGMPHVGDDAYGANAAA